MRFRKPYSDSLAAVVRAHFALSQAELASFLGVSRALLANIEADCRKLTGQPLRRLLVLARQLPAPDGEGPAAPDFDRPSEAAAEAPDLAELRFRRQEVHVAILQQELALDQRAARQLTHARRRWALQVLGPALAAPSPADARWAAATPDAARDLKWLAELARDTAHAPVPLTATERALRTARLRGLHAERTALDELLDGEPGAGPGKSTPDQ